MLTADFPLARVTALSFGLSARHSLGGGDFQSADISEPRLLAYTLTSTTDQDIHLLTASTWQTPVQNRNCSTLSCSPRCCACRPGQARPGDTLDGMVIV